MARYAYVNNNIVAEVIETGKFPINACVPPDRVDKYVACNDPKVEPGYRYTNGSFYPPEPVDPVLLEKTKTDLEKKTLADITIKQLTLAMHDEGLITEQEIENWLTKTGLPAFVTSLLDKLPTDKKLSAKATFLTMTVAQRTDPLITFIVENSKDLLGKEITDADVNTFWKKALAIT